VIGEVEQSQYADVARTVQARIEQLALLSDETECLTRLLGGRAMCQATAVVAEWMDEAGLDVRRDIVGNIIGRTPSAGLSGTWLIGSHIDTVPDAGRYDGVLGVLIGISVAEQLGSGGLPFALEVVGFVDEEGVRFGTSYLGSRVYRDGRITADDLQRVDANGVGLQAILDGLQDDGLPPPVSTGCPSDIAGYLEVHIEQGPTLDAQCVPLGVVRGIRGQATGSISFHGRAGHAGTVPMSERYDALCAAAELITCVETVGQITPGLVATVGEIRVEPGARNVIPKSAEASIDIRHADVKELGDAVSRVRRHAAEIAQRRGLNVSWNVSIGQAPVHCDTAFSDMLSESVTAIGQQPISLDSGAGHDAAILAEQTGIAMLFVRCEDGVSHHPDEAVSTDDIRAAVACVVEFFTRMSGRPGSPTT
jgi:allantoate deiminase